MVEIIINENKLILAAPFSQDYKGGNFEILLDNITDVEIDLTLARNLLRKLDFLAEFIPSVKRRGVYYEDCECIYWEVKNPAKTIIIYLRNEPHEKLIVEVENLQVAIEKIGNALRDNELEEETPTAELIVDY